MRLNMFSNASKNDSFSALLPELFYRILNLLSVRDLLACCQVCWRWNFITSDDFLWYKRCKSDGLTHRAKGDLSWKRVYLQEKQTCQRWLGSLPSAPPSVISLKSVAPCTDLVVHHDALCASLSLQDGLLLIADLSHHTSLLLLTITTPTWSLLPLTVDGEALLACGGADGTVRIISIHREGCMVREFSSIEVGSVVRCLAASQSEGASDEVKIVAGGRTGVIAVWGLQESTGRPLLLTGHSGAVHCVKATRSTVVSASYDCTVIVWSLATGQSLHVFLGHYDRVYTFILLGGLVVSSSLDTTMRVWDIANGACLHTLVGHLSLTKEIATDTSQSIVVSGNADRSVRVWDPVSGECRLVLAHTAPVTSVLVVKDRFIVSSTADGIVKLFHLGNGSFVREILSLGATAVVWKIVAMDTILVCACGSTDGSMATALHLFDFSSE